MNRILKVGKPKENARVEEMRDEMLNGSKSVKYSINIPRKLHGEFRKKAFLSSVKMSDILLEAIYDYLKE